MTEKLVILDRDGVINADSENYIKSPAEWHPIKDSLKAIQLLNDAGFRVVVATNQSGLARGLFSLNDLEAIHNKFTQQLAAAGGKLDGIFFCPHGPNDNCSCRKPKPGLIWSIRDALKINTQGCFFVGDSFRDIQAANSAGCRPILVKTGNGLTTLRKHTETLADVPVFDDLYNATQFIITH